MNEQQLDALFSALQGYLNSKESGLKRSHVRSIGDIEKTNPWRETNWRSESLSVSHWENVITPGHMSGPSPRHTWKVGIKGIDGSFRFSYGHAPRKGEK